MVRECIQEGKRIKPRFNEEVTLYKNYSCGTTNNSQITSIVEDY